MIRTKVLGSGPLARILDAAIEGARDMVVRRGDPDVTVIVGDGDISDGSRGVYLVVGPDDAESMVAAVEAGARGYVSVNQPVAEMLMAIRTVAGGGASVPDDLLGALLSHVVRRRRVRESLQARLDTLTPREMEIFRAAARGLDKAAIGQLLFISSETARTHLGRVRRKLGVSSHAGLVALAAECGLDTSPMDPT
jgi:DNA-binding NarL/FixJ family response regulator